MFRKDKWLNWTLQIDLPKSYSFAKNVSISISKAFSMQSIFDMFNLPLSEVAFSQVENLQQIMDAAALENEVDIWACNGGSTKFSSSKAYRKLIGHHHTDPVFKWIWKNFCQPKHKVFTWLLLKDRLSTRNILRRKNMHLDSYNCEFCNMGGWRIIWTSLSPLPFCPRLLGHLPFGDSSCWGNNWKFQCFQNSATFSVLHGRNHADLLDHLDSQEWANLQSKSNVSDWMPKLPL